MKRLHIHLAVEDLASSVRFYSALFASQPTVEKTDYAKWMLDDPRVNFAISQRGATPGLDHLGIQVESEAELAEMHARLQDAALPVDAQIGTACCYARSDKYWTVDPQGVAWETYQTLAHIPTFGESRTAPANEPNADASTCCSPARGKPIGVPVKSSCC
ncbi:glyoxalase [Burkholderia ubonensis]|uniref:Glyoxalase n=1 Tax=Burkholderia ubonensis TaxID=101571 RepID=A0AB73FSW6_9BURK|nr:MULTISPECIES: ArsI/CadI family heavy metal resistance metalloenzyme [Burkholderia]KGU73672.1 glyoxalase/Bleomycin resistance /Dioxygenase superfamily protein [Burkholderia pseudomallei MSHR4304]KGV30276.1 glyoxalase/Bleomycin resistance /Dioxygenase superfamily protein [Burkholderia pseudomallei MSHR4308]KGW06407.1 glyoxalase/Bleomycin resistance /Dioxygenase superfamily protein [Burkholderia pseudomallei MSHR4303]KVK87734.1 glyoxalase [Burkholderia ubonensis]KVL66261.1 glyoxalase [Burkhold